MRNVANYISVVITNHCTPALLVKAVQSFRSFYLDVPIIMVDNGSMDDSLDTISRLMNGFGGIVSIIHPHNIGHGPAMHDAIVKSSFPYIFTLDTDCEILDGGFLELMLQLFDDRRLYATGWLRWANDAGVSLIESEAAKLTVETERNYTPTIHPHAMLLDRRKYLTLLPFDFSGAPCFNNMRHAVQRQYTVASFPVSDYIKHLVAGTRRMWGGEWNTGDTKPRCAWEEKERFQI